LGSAGCLYFTGLLILAAMTLFLMNAVAGRIWCGCLCWQTIWTDLFYAMERWVEAIPVTFTAQASGGTAKAVAPDHFFPK
jgi:polyferredoxin